MTNKTQAQLINQLAEEQIKKHSGFVAKSAIERLAYELDFSVPETVAIAALIADDCSLIDSIKMAPQLQDLIKCDPRVKLLMGIGLRIEEKVSAETGKEGRC